MKSEPLQVRVLERSFIFEAKTEHSIHADVREPNCHKRQAGIPSRQDEYQKQDQRSGISMDKIVRGRSHFPIDEIAQHD